MFEASARSKAFNEEGSDADNSSSVETHRTRNRRSDPKTIPTSSLQLGDFSAEENRALQFWRQCTGPWLANCSSNGHRKVWEITFPRCAMRLAATRHLLVAVALMDEHLPSPSFDMLVHRSQRILFHYNTAIKELTRDRPFELDVMLATILAWVLEIFLADQAKARMHLEASSSFLEKLDIDRLYKEDEEAHDILFEDVVPVRGDCSGFSSSQKSLESATPKTSISVLTVLTAKNYPSQIASPYEAREACARYLSSLDPLSTPGTSSEAPAADLSHWQRELFKCRYELTAHPVNIVAIQLLYSLAMVVVVAPPCNRRLEDEYPDPAAVHYVLDKSADFFALEVLGTEDRAELETTLGIVMNNVLRFSRNEMHCTRARHLLQQYLPGLQVRSQIS